MAPLQFLCVILLLSATSRAQEQDVTKQNTDNAVPADGETLEQLVPAPLESEKSAEPAIEAVGPVPVSPLQPAPNESFIEASATELNETKTAPLEIENPQIAAKQMEGSSGLDQTPLLAEPDAIKKVLGSRCTGDNDCLSINNTNCIDGLCICKTGFIPSKHSLDKCMKVPSGLGDECEEEAQCSHTVPNSECRESKCDCPLNYVLHQGSCWEKQMLGGICNNSMQCDDITFATCAQGVCTCESPLIPSPVNKCLQPAGELYHAPCVEDIQCTHSYGDEARCSGDQCRCTNDYHYNGTKCIVDKKLGETCVAHEDCTVSEVNHLEGSRECLENICTCATGFKTLPGEDICTNSSGEELAVSLTWAMCIILAKYYLS